MGGSEQIDARIQATATAAVGHTPPPAGRRLLRAEVVTDLTDLESLVSPDGAAAAPPATAYAAPGSSSPGTGT